ncbi:MAG: RNA polymerase sigma factor [Candidatus Dormibacteria bacterium]
MSSTTAASAGQLGAEPESDATHDSVAAEMYSKHYPAVFRYVRSRVGTHTEAEDLTGDVFCKAVTGLKNYRTIRSSALPWLYTIAAHRVVDHYRAARPTAELDAAQMVADTSPNPADVVVTKDLIREVWELSNGLPPSQRRALWLRYGEDRELREIAVLMGRSVEAVKLLVHRAIRGVRTRLPISASATRVALLPAGDGGRSATATGRRAAAVKGPALAA